MRYILVFTTIFLFGCTSTQPFEEIAEGIMEEYSAEQIFFYSPLWVPIGAPEINELEKFNLTDEQVTISKEDQDLCVAPYRGEKFKSEALAIAYLMQCMNMKGWRWDTEVIIIISH